MNELLLKLREAWALHQQGRLKDAHRLYCDVLVREPENANALHFLGVLEAQRGQYELAAQLMSRSLAINPHNAAALYNLGNALRALSRLDEALSSYERANVIKPDHAGAFAHRAEILYQAERYTEALVCFERLAALDTKNADAHVGCGNTLVELNRAEDALTCFEHAQSLVPDHAGAFFGRGNALIRLNRIDEAVADYDRTLALTPNDASVLGNRGEALGRLGRFEEALASLGRAIAADPENAGTFSNRGKIQTQMKRYQEALADYDRALALAPSCAEALYGRGSTLVECNRHGEAVAAFKEVLRLKPNYPYALGMLVYAQRSCCDWSDEAAISAMLAAIRAGQRTASPIALLAVSDSPDDKLICSQIVMRDRHPSPPPPLWRGERYEHERVRVAYVSADFREHPVATVMAGVFEHHDRSRFETIALSYGPDDGSAMRTRLTNAFNRFIDVRSKSDFEIASLLRTMEADIAVDLTGFTGDGRPGIFVFRPAPVQVNYLGFAGTMGGEHMDYILADPTVIPPEHAAAYTEKVARLPHCYLPYDSKRAIAQRPTHAQAGLPENGFVFCSFNNSYKFWPAVFDVWMRLLRAVEGSVLWLPSSNPAAMSNLKREAQARGIAATRIVFAAYQPKGEDHLARLSLADLFLDTFPYNAHSTAADTLWAGLPVIACRGDSFASRVAASLLQAIGLPEMVTDSLPAYERLALRLARDAAALKEIRDRLWRNRGTHPLFDTVRFTRNLETAFTHMWRRSCAGEPPASFTVDDTPIPSPVYPR